MESLKDRRESELEEYKFPKHCPVCHSKLVRLEGEAEHFCINPDCPARIVESMIHFASREAMDIDSLGDKRSSSSTIGIISIHWRIFIAFTNIKKSCSKEKATLKKESISCWLILKKAKRGR